MSLTDPDIDTVAERVAAATTDAEPVVPQATLSVDTHAVERASVGGAIVSYVDGDGPVMVGLPTPAVMRRAIRATTRFETVTPEAVVQAIEQEADGLARPEHIAALNELHAEVRE